MGLHPRALQQPCSTMAGDVRQNHQNRHNPLHVGLQSYNSMIQVQDLEENMKPFRSFRTHLLVLTSAQSSTKAILQAAIDYSNTLPTPTTTEISDVFKSDNLRGSKPKVQFADVENNEYFSRTEVDDDIHPSSLWYTFGEYEQFRAEYKDEGKKLAKEHKIGGQASSMLYAYEQCFRGQVLSESDDVQQRQQATNVLLDKNFQFDVALIREMSEFLQDGEHVGLAKMASREISSERHYRRASLVRAVVEQSNNRENKVDLNRFAHFFSEGLIQYRESEEDAIAIRQECEKWSQPSALFARYLALAGALSLACDEIAVPTTER